MTDLKYSPIAVFTYNRADKTKNLIESLLKNPESAESDLYVFSDGAKSGQEENVAAVRQYLDTVTGFKSINIIKASKNKGLAASIIDGVTSVIEKYGRCIVLEDDLICSDGLLSYMNCALSKYENEENVYSVSGYSYLKDAYKEGVEDYYFLPLICSWGWATWADRWKKFDPDATGYRRLKKDQDLRERFDYDYPYTEMLLWQMEQHTLKGYIQRKIFKKPGVNSWAIRWYWSVFVNDGLNIYPKDSLIENNGFDGSGTHCGTGKNDIRITNTAEKSINLPTDIVLDDEICSRVKKSIGRK